MSKFKGKVKEDVERQNRERKKEQAEEFARLYDKTKKNPFPPKDKINMDKFVGLPKSLVKLGLSKAALAVYPVLCSQADFETDDWFQISQDNIKTLSGYSIPSVKKALDELAETELVARRKISERGRNFYIYRVEFIRRHMLESGEHKGNCVYFYTCIIDSGIWAKLKPRAKALYLSMRIFAEQDPETYSCIEGLAYDETNFDEYIRERKWDVCTLPLAEMCRQVGIESSNNRDVLAELERHQLAEKVGRFIKVYLKPRIRYGDTK
jgi:predicted transcriptional regulator